MTKILLITLSNIGDAVLTTAVLDVLVRTFRNASVTVLVGPRAKEVFEGDPAVSRVIVYEKKSGLFDKIKLARNFSKEAYDFVIDLRHTLLPLLIKAGKKTRLFRGKRDLKKHALLRHLDEIKVLGLNVENARMRLSLNSESEKKADEIFAANEIDISKTVALAPGAASSLKRWKADRFLL
ncbi:MAG: hypothetical protein P9M03_10440 [Candidatus Theseobacter exili]|nr:hypothetical protein [Candidatus Theseobacter exili]